MKTILITSVLVFSVSGAAQQQPYYTSPRGMLTSDGNSHATHFGGFANARYMVFDG